MPLPTFIIVGAQKCGTSSLAVLLRYHPEVHLVLKKEVHFFDWYFSRGVDWYADQFKPMPGQHVFGEATPTYSYFEPARRRMIQTLPDLKVILITRDPIDRAYSHYWHSERLGYEPIPTFEEAVEAEPARLASGQQNHLIRHSYLDRGRYIDQVEALAAVYGRDRVHVMTLDNLSTDTKATLESVFGFLEVDPDQAGPILATQMANRAKRGDAPRENQAKPYPPISTETRTRLIEVFRDPNDRLASWMGQDLSTWNKV